MIVFLDSHSEVCDGWLEPLLLRIKGDRRRVVVPHIRSLDPDTLRLSPGHMWPPSKGSFNWRLSFTIVPADVETDLVSPSERHSPVLSPVMPGGLFAMDREYFFELGEYDPDILYYGGEHVELSFRVWMCGGSMEWIPCSNVGHIYRRFDRFRVDPQLKNINIWPILDRNDKRVAAVWMDDYAKIFLRFRGLAPGGEGNLTSRHALRSRLHCHDFKWFLNHVAADLYVPDLHVPLAPRISDPSGKFCLDGGGRATGSVAVKACSSIPSQAWVFTSRHYIQREGYVGYDLPCLRCDAVSMVECASKDAVAWTFHESALHPQDRPGLCLERVSDRLALRPCRVGRAAQQWNVPPPGTAGVLADKDRSVCLDNMQRRRGAPGLYGCHGGDTQQWTMNSKGVLTSSGTSDVCLGTGFTAAMDVCALDKDYEWVHTNGTLRPVQQQDHCLQRSGASVMLTPCASNSPHQQWSV